MYDRDLFFKEHEDSIKRFLLGKISLSSSFTWNRSYQGYDYWSQKDRFCIENFNNTKIITIVKHFPETVPIFKEWANILRVESKYLESTKMEDLL